MRSPSLVLAGHDIFFDRPSFTGTEAGITVSADQLEATLGGIRLKGYEFVKFDEFMERRRGGGVAILTFDDAYCSVLDIAGPILRKTNTPAVVFAVTSGLHLKSDPFPIWVQVMRDGYHALGEGALETLSDHRLISRALTRFLSLADLLQQPFGVVTELFRQTFTVDELDELAAAVAHEPSFGRVTLDSQKLSSWLDTGEIEVGAHSVTHRSFSLLDEHEIYNEITNSLSTISELTGKPAATLPFAYPYGALTAYAVSVVSQVSRAGFSCNQRAISFDPRAALPRFHLGDTTLTDVQRGNGVERMASLVADQLMLRVRDGPAWRLMSPIRKAVRSLGSPQ